MTAKPYALLINTNSGVSDCISLGYMAAHVRALGYGAEVVDLAHKTSQGSLLQLVQQQDPQLIGLSAHQIVMQNVLLLARWFKQVSRARVVLGGAQIPAMPAQALQQLEHVDYLCRGEGELVLEALLRHLDGSLALGQVPGISYRDGGGVRTNPNPPVPEDLDVYPSPHLTGVLRPRPGHLSRLLTSRGCSYECTFCVTPGLSQRKIRFHSIDRVLEEVAFLHRQGQRELWIADPLFLASKERVKQILQRLIDTGLQLNTWFETRANLMDRELAELLRRAGVRRLAFGLESSNQRALDRMRKRQEIEDFTETVRMVKEQGITVDLLHIVGGPDDTFDSTMDNLDYVRRLGNYLDGYNAGNNYSLYFGSEASADPAAAGMIVDEVVLQQSWPAYLSPGTRARPASLGPGDRRRIRRRLANEAELAEIVRLAQALEHNGLPPDDELNALLPRLRQLRQLSHAGRMDLNVMGTSRLVNDDGPLELVLLRGRGDLAGGPGARELRLLLQRMTYYFQLVLMADDGCLLLDRALADLLVELLTPPVLYLARVLFTVDPPTVERQGAQLRTALARFFVDHQPPGMPQGRWPLAQLTALLDLTAWARPSMEQLNRAAVQLARSGVDLFPLFCFEGPGAVQRFCQSMAALQGQEGYDQLVLAGSMEPDTMQPLLDAYHDMTPSWRLPPMLLLQPNVLLLHREGWRPMELGAHLIVWCDDWQRRRENTRPVNTLEARW